MCASSLYIYIPRHAYSFALVLMPRMQLYQLDENDIQTKLDTLFKKNLYGVSFLPILLYYLFKILLSIIISHFSSSSFSSSSDI